MRETRKETPLQRDIRIVRRVRARLVSLWFDNVAGRLARDAEVRALDRVVDLALLAPEIEQFPVEEDT